MFERFTDRARLVFVGAHDEVRARGGSEVGTEHVLLGLLRDPSSDAGRAFTSLGVTLQSAGSRVGAPNPSAAGPSAARSGDAVAFSTRVKKLLERSLREALRLGAQRIGTGHLALGMLDVGDGGALHVLAELGVDPDALRAGISESLAFSAEISEERPLTPVVLPELTPETQQRLRTALRIGSTFVAGRYLPVRMALGASTTARVVRRLGAASSPPGSAAIGPGAASPVAPLVPAACSVCATPSPVCGTLYQRGDALVCERCAGPTP